MMMTRTEAALSAAESAVEALPDVDYDLAQDVLTLLEQPRMRDAALASRTIASMVRRHCADVERVLPALVEDGDLVVIDGEFYRATA